MDLHLNWINILVLFGALQGLIFSLILMFNKKHPGSKFLAGFIFVLTYNGFETFNWSSGLDRYYLFFDMFGYVVIYGLGPSLYLYTRSLLYPLDKIRKRTVLMHYAPVIFYFTSRVAVISYHLLWINKVVSSSVSPNDLMSILLFYAEPLSVLLFVAYLVASIIEFRKFRADKQIKPVSKETRENVFRWVKMLLIALSIFAVCWILTVAAPYFTTISFGSHYYPIELGLVFFIYWIVLNGYHKMKLIYLKPTGPSPFQLPEPELDNHYKKLVSSMEQDKIYQDPELSLAKLSSVVGLPAKTISAILNQHKQVSFNDFVNGYRVGEVCRKITDPANQHLTISGIAFDAGFNSQPTFLRAFKKNMGMAPKDYVNRRLKRPA